MTKIRLKMTTKEKDTANISPDGPVKNTGKDTGNIRIKKKRK